VWQVRVESTFTVCADDEKEAGIRALDEAMNLKKSDWYVIAFENVRTFFA
jgi:hypothetical protein